jgi:hypothetical protein
MSLLARCCCCCADFAPATNASQISSWLGQLRLTPWMRCSEHASRVERMQGQIQGGWESSRHKSACRFHHSSQARQRSALSP